MSYEAGSKECRHLIEAKESLLSAMQSLSNIKSTDGLQIQIKEIYNKLEQMHDNRKKNRISHKLSLIFQINRKFSKLAFYPSYSFFW